MRPYNLKRFFRLYGAIEVLKIFLWKLKIAIKGHKQEDALTIIITSAGRKDYLAQTIESLSANIKYNGKVYWHIIDDNPNSLETREYIKSLNFDKVIFNKKNRGLGISLNKIYRTLKTRYILHCEDDWLFLREVNINKLINTLNSQKEDLQLILNRREPYKIAPVIKNEKAYITRYYSFNPHLICFSLVPKILPFSIENTERTLSDRMRRKNIKSLVYGYGKVNFTSHIGEIRKVEKY